MSLPDPRPGLVIRYGFLWSHEADYGAEESTKDRPCTIVVAARRGPDGKIRTILAPITHAPPSDLSSSLELPRDVCRQLGLDDGRHWVRFEARDVPALDALVCGQARYWLELALQLATVGTVHLAQNGGENRLT